MKLLIIVLLVDWFPSLADIKQAIINAVVAVLQVAYDLLMDIVVTIITALVNAIPQQALPAFQCIIPYFQAANDWVPLSELLLILGTYITWEFGFIAFRTVKRFLPTMA
jgi:hypothetical protein